MTNLRFLGVAIALGLAFISPSHADDGLAGVTTRFECKHYATDADFDKNDLPLAFSFDVVGDAHSLDSKWTMIRLDGQTATADTFEIAAGAFGTMYPVHGSLGLKVTPPDKQPGNLYLIFGQELPNGVMHFWLGFDRPNFFQPSGYGCDNEKALAAGAEK
ncbi:MAG: hypothetical protein AB7U34_00810 [Novosphingobium sp.]